ncbi:PAS domain S-box protein [Kitasatospora sp. MBT63]
MEGVITTWNPAAERMYGYSGAEAVGRPPDRRRMGRIQSLPDPG